MAAYRLCDPVMGLVYQRLLLLRTVLHVVVGRPKLAEVIVYLCDIDAWMCWVGQVGGMMAYLAQPLVLVADAVVVALTHSF